MKVFSLIAFLLLAAFLKMEAQTDKGWDVPVVTSEQNTGETYALIVGVSKYKNLPSQLKYADRDASVFHQYLLASGVKQDQIHTLINEEALKGSIWAEVEYLLDVAKKGDVVYVYFSGHGDVERKTIGKKAYLLPYDSETHGYVSCAVGIPDLKDYFATLSSHGVQLIFIGDACRVGNLVGGMEGIAATASLLQEQWTNEIKILSCQPGQLSQESKQWGNGRGLFSFELINGLSGMADRNKNNEITLRELELYLMEKVPEAADPNKQDPIIETSNKDFVISRVTPAISALGSQQPTGLIASIDMKGSEELLLGNMNDSIRAWYYAFQRCMDNGNYLSLEKVDQKTEAEIKAKGVLSKKANAGYYEVTQSAFYYYTKIPTTDSTNILTSFMKRNLSAELMNNIRDFERVMRGDSLASDSKFSSSAFNVSMQETKELIYKLGVESVALRELMGDARLKKLGFFSSRVLVEVTGYFATANVKAIGNSGPLLDSAIRYTPDMPDLNWLRGKVTEFQIAKGGGMNLSPIPFYVKELELNPKRLRLYDDVYSWYGVHEHNDSLLQFAKASAASIRKTDPFFSDFLIAHAFEYLGQKDSMQAYTDRLSLRDFRKTDDESDGPILFHVSAMKAEQGRCAEAKTFYDLALSRNLKNTVAPVSEAYCFASEEKKPEALQYIHMSLKEYDEVDHYKIGRAYALIGENAKARDQYEMALKKKSRKFYSELSASQQQRFSSIKGAFETVLKIYDVTKKGD